jgi:hypothetical protein
MTDIAYHFTVTTKPPTSKGQMQPFNALKIGRGSYLHRVKEGKVTTIDATHLLRRFAADQALSVAHLWDMPKIVRDYLTKLDEGKRAAAQYAALDAAQDAANWAADAAWAAAVAAADAAAWYAAVRTAAARAADCAAARTAALDAARVDFNARVELAFQEMTQ